MGRPIRSIVIVGGGTAGWTAAAYLNRALGRRVEITVVESERIGRIGVGEATVPTLRNTFAFIGMDEADWMPKCNATFKSAVKFVNWKKRQPGQPEHSYYHPFFVHPEPFATPWERPYFVRMGQGFSTVHYWLRNWMAGDRRTFGEVTNPLQRLCELNKSPRPLPGSGVPDPGFAYAYQFDAALIAQYLRELAVGRGVKHVIADVQRVELDDKGHVSRLHTEQGPVVEGELFIDCSGFRALLIEGALKEPFVSANDYLLCDSAVALPSNNDPEKNDLRPYTQANAQGHGWIWEIPLYHRDGSGYVYCSKTTTASEAEETLRRFMGPRAQDGVKANHIKMRVGHHRRSWVNNVVAIGLSSCFVEPLESTTIFLIEYEIACLLQQLPDSDFDEQRRRRYNELILDAFQDVRDFIVLHYCLTDRDDTEFWRQVRAAPVPDSLQAKIDRFAEGVIMPEGTAVRLFETRSFACILSGMGYPFRRSPPSSTRSTTPPPARCWPR